MVGDLYVASSDARGKFLREALKIGKVTSEEVYKMSEVSAYFAWVLEISFELIDFEELALQTL